MSLRTFFALLLSGGLAFTILLSYGTQVILENRIYGLLPPTTDPATLSAIHLLVIGDVAVVVIFSIFISLLLFWVFGAVIAKPLRKLVKIMSAFAADGTRMELPRASGVANEISLLGEAFTTLADKVQESHKKDVEISRVKSDFISTAAHQLRTPLTGIRWALEALEMENLTEDQKSLVKNAADKAHDLVAIVGTLLDISSIESGKYKYKFELVDIGKLVAEVAQDFSPLAQKSNIALFYAKESTPLPKVKVDRDRIKWVLNNLIENAIRYTPSPGSVHLTVEVSANDLYIKVKDTGIGIEAKDRGNIFERFYRAGNAITKENQGNGLGLYIARTIATDHGGDLYFAPNTEGPGTTFVLSLPLA